MNEGKVINIGKFTRGVATATIDITHRDRVELIAFSCALGAVLFVDKAYFLLIAFDEDVEKGFGFQCVGGIR